MRSNPVRFEDVLTILAVGYAGEPSARMSHVYAVRPTNSPGETGTFVLREKDIVTVPDHPVGSTLIFCVGGIQLPVRVAGLRHEDQNGTYRFDGSDGWHTASKINDVLNHCDHCDCQVDYTSAYGNLSSLSSTGTEVSGDHTNRFCSGRRRCFTR